MEIKASALEPELLLHARYWWHAYVALTRARVWTEGRPLAIPLTEIEAYTRMQNYDSDMTDDLLYYVEALEGVYFEWYARQSKKNMGKGKGMSGKRPTRK